MRYHYVHTVWNTNAQTSKRPQCQNDLCHTWHWRTVRCNFALYAGPSSRWTDMCGQAMCNCKEESGLHFGAYSTREWSKNHKMAYIRVFGDPFSGYRWSDGHVEEIVHRQFVQSWWGPAAEAVSLLLRVSRCGKADCDNVAVHCPRLCVGIILFNSAWRRVSNWRIEETLPLKQFTAEHKVQWLRIDKGQCIAFKNNLWACSNSRGLSRQQNIPSGNHSRENGKQLRSIFFVEGLSADTEVVSVGFRPLAIVQCRSGSSVVVYSPKGLCSHGCSLTTMWLINGTLFCSCCGLLRYSWWIIFFADRDAVLGIPNRRGKA